MIIRIERSFLQDVSREDIAELYSTIFKNGHYLDVDSATLSLLRHSLDVCGSLRQKTLVRNNYQNHLSSELRHYLTTIQSADYSFDELMIIVSKPSYLLIENLPYESEVYRQIIGTYVNDPQFGNLFKKLFQAKNRGLFSFLHAGGFGMMQPLLEYYDKREYKNVTDKKIAILMDRDTDSGTKLPPSRNALFRFLSGKDSTQLTNKDIYCLSQRIYIWHMWYKRAIENYFPASQFDNLGLQSATAPVAPSDWSYKNLGGKKRGVGIRGYKKSRLSDVSYGMSRVDYNTNCSSFNLNGLNVTEMQLFLLKLVKLI